ncbi:glycosyltransferase family 2 protein [bacterium]|nr:glycosyltransferase family 2 protein [candidate division CSSED10-310 bacterium]
MNTTAIPLPLLSISVITIGHQSEGDLVDLLPQLLADAPALGMEIVVVDNASTDGTRALLDRYRRDIMIITNDRNRGFGAAVNQGLQRTRGQYVLLLNPDARIDPDAIRSLKGYLDTHAATGAVAPRLEYPDGRLQPSRGSFPSVFRTLASLFQLKRLMPDDETVMRSPLRFLGRVFRQYAPPQAEEIVDYTTGACVLLRRSALDTAGAFDESFFLYYEEIDLAKRLKEAGYNWVYLDRVIARHAVAASSDKAPLRPFLERCRSMCYYYSKHHSFRAGFIVRQMLYITILIRWLLILIHPRFRLDPRVPIAEETAVYRRLLRRRTHI